MTFQDISYAVRALRRRPGFTFAAGLSLALGIGATTAIFGLLNAVALRPLPYPDADRLVWLTQVLKKNSTDEVTVTAHFLEWRRQQHSFYDLAGYSSYQTRNLTGLEEPIEVHTAKASASLLTLLRVQPALGRNFLRAEDYKGRDQVVLLTDEFWRQRFGGDPAIVGRSITLDGVPCAVVGVLPPGFVFPGPDPVDLMAPLGKDEAAELEHREGSIIFNVIGRLRPGVTAEQARAELTVIQSRLPVPPFRPTITLRMMPLREHLFGNVRIAGLVLVAAAGFLLLIACANVGNLLLVRFMQRDRELAIRTVLGGSRARLIGQLLTESALLGILACGTGIGIAFWLRGPLLALSPYRSAALDRLPFDWRVLFFAIAAGLLTILLFGLAPAFRTTEIRLAEAIKTGESSVLGGHRSARLLSLFASVEIATILVLATGAGLMLQSFWRMRYENLGFQPERLTAAGLKLAGPRYRHRTEQFAFIRNLIERATALPGVEAAAVTDSNELPPGNSHATNTFNIEGRYAPLGGVRPIARYQVVSAGYFRILGIPLIRGRLLADSDGENATPVVVINRRLANRYFGGEDPLGKRLRTGGSDFPWHTIVGIVGDVKTSGLAADPEPSLYFPYPQMSGLASISLVVRSSLDTTIIAGELRKAVANLDPNQPVATVQPMSERLSASVSKPRFTTVLLCAFAGLAALLGIIGVYGVMGCRVRWQLRELALRQALGAERKDVVWLVLRQGAAIIIPGLCVGLTGAIALSRLLSSLLFEVRASDPLTYGAVSIALAGAALLACWIPAVRAARTDPLVLLRHE